MDGVVHRQDGTAGVPEDVLDLQFHHQLLENLRPRHADILVGPIRGALDSHGFLSLQT